jgi:hypothetical protein
MEKKQGKNNNRGSGWLFSCLQWFVCSGMFGGLTCVCFFFCVFVLDHCTISIPVVVRNRGVVWVMVWKGSQELNHQNAEQETNLMLPVQVGKQLT